MHCPFCGANLTTGTEYCGTCGRDVRAYTAGRPRYAGAPGHSADRPVLEEKPSKPKGLIIALCCVAAVAVIAIGVLLALLLPKKEQTDELAAVPSQTEAIPASDVPAIPTETASIPAQTESAAPTESVTESAAPEPTTPGQITIDSDTQYRLNLFLSNFSESFFTDWEAGNSSYSTFERLRFIFSWYNLNKYDQLKIDNTDFDASLTFEQVNERHERFFGESLSRPSEGARFTSEYGERITFQDGCYVTPWGVGDSHADFSVATELTDNGDGSYTVKFDVYTAEDFNGGGDHLDDESYYKLTPATVGSRNVTYRYSGYAVIVPYKKGSVDSYQLKAYFRD